MPGFGLTMGYTLFALGGVVLLPLAALFLRALDMTWEEFWRQATSARALSAYRLTLGASFVAALFNAFMGTLTAWVLVRYTFPGRRILDALVDFPFALPTAVAGLTLANLFAPGGLMGRVLEPLGIRVAYTPLGIVVALIFVGLPFVVRTLQPVLAELERDTEEAAATLGAGRLRTLVAVVAPTLFPAILTGFALAFARAVGEYGSVLFISSGRPLESEIVPMVIVVRLDEFNTRGAIAVAVVMLVLSFAMLVLVNALERRASRFLR